MLTEEERLRYDRQIIYPQFGEGGQKKIRQARILIVGVGGLGSPAAVSLAYAGVGRIRLVDPDPVELSNLNRQTLHWEEDIGKKKVQSAAEKLKRINASLDVEPVPERLTSGNARKLLKGMDMAIDCVDNFEARFILNDACVKAETPFVHGGVSGLKGQVATIIPPKTPCLRCIFPDPPVDKGPIPVFGVTPSVVASIQAMEAIKYISGFGKLLTGKLLCFRGEEMNFFSIRYRRRDDCEACGKSQSPPQS